MEHPNTLGRQNRRRQRSRAPRGALALRRRVSAAWPPALPQKGFTWLHHRSDSAWPSRRVGPCCSSTSRAIRRQTSSVRRGSEDQGFWGFTTLWYFGVWGYCGFLPGFWMLLGLLGWSWDGLGMVLGWSWFPTAAASASLLASAIPAESSSERLWGDIFKGRPVGLETS